MRDPPWSSEIARHVWETRYRFRPLDGTGEERAAVPYDSTLADTWDRVATALAAVEAPAVRETWRRRFRTVLADFRFLPGGRILAGAGTGRRVTLANCFVMGVIEDSLDGIFRALHEGALTLQAGGGVGYDFSTLRPRGTPARGAGTIASGPVSFLHVWDAACATLLSTGSRRGAMMGTLRCDHPDVGEFLNAKREPGVLTYFNLSLQVTDELLRAVDRGDDWPLIFPKTAFPPPPAPRKVPGTGTGVGAGKMPGTTSGAPEKVPGTGPDAGSVSPGKVPGTEQLVSSLGTVHRPWTGSGGRPVPCRVAAVMPARELWHSLVRAAWERSEPGVLFVDRIAAENDLAWCEEITTTNPCGEVPLPPYGACLLGSLNLPRFVVSPFTDAARLDLDTLAATAAVATRLLDDAVDAGRFPLPAQAEQARRTRRIGLGFTGLADALAMLGLPYGGEAARRTAARAMETICLAAYRASVELAREKEPFPDFVAEPFLDGGFARRLPPELRHAIARHGLRNSHLTAVAPAGTISLLAGNVSSGVEPIFAVDATRRVLDAGGTPREIAVTDRAADLWRRTHPGRALPRDAFVTARELPVSAHLEMAAAVARHVDSSVSKTVNVPPDLPFSAFGDVYRRAWELGLKGCTTFRPAEATGEAVLRPAQGDDVAPCGTERCD
jgi:ribonucleoside-diphosphate reductase alpha chain